MYKLFGLLLLLDVLVAKEGEENVVSNLRGGSVGVAWGIEISSDLNRVNLALALALTLPPIPTLT